MMLVLSDARDCYERTALHLAAFHGLADMVDLLIANRASVSRHDSPLWLHNAFVCSTESLICNPKGRRL
jgi:ankyrin repeat protein